MLEHIEELKKNLDQVIGNTEILNLAKSVEGLEIAISNANLLVNALISFYKGEKADYFPRYITEQIGNCVKDANAQIKALLAKDQSQSKSLQQNLDKLYAICLQSGIVSFGFRAKELIQILDNAKRDVQNLGKKVIELSNEIDKKTQEFQKNVNEKKATLDSNVNVSKELKDKITQTEQSTKEKHKGVVKLLDTANQVLAEIKKTQQESAATQNAIDAENKNAQNLISQIQAKLDNANQTASQITAKNNTANETLAAINERKKAADEFYTTVENYKKEMLDSIKSAKADYSELKQTCDNKISEYSTKTDEIIKQNISYQEQIQELLTKAVSGGLFRVFSQRQEFLSKGTRFWRWAVVVTSVLLAGGILLVAWICEAKPDIIFFVRLAIMIPLAFLMFFSATQYKKERQAEEEYAFKSAISLSIEPYRDLLVRMRKEDQVEADFVKKLMEDVFDNPVMRLFNIEEEEEKIVKMILNFLKKLPKGKSSAIIEQVSKKILE